MGLFVKKLQDQRGLPASAPGRLALLGMRAGRRWQAGYSLLEVGIVVAVFSTLISIATINLLGSKQKASVAGTLTLVISDTKHQQTKAMTMTTQEGLTTNYGIYFTPQNYILFKGSYNPSDPSNFTVAYDENIVASVSALPQSSILFARQSGEVVNFDPTKNTLTLINTITNEKKTIRINRYGVITQAN